MTNSGWFFDEQDDAESQTYVEDADFEIIDKNRDRETGKLLSFLVMENGEPIPKKATAENVLLYEHGLKEFLSGNHAVIVSEANPELIIAPTGNDMAYLLRVNGSTVETTPSQARKVLEGLKDAVEARNSAERDAAIGDIVSVYDTIISTQVRRWLVRALKTTFTPQEQGRIQEISRGWLIDGFYLVDWNASLYSITDDPDEKDWSVGGGAAQQVDTSYEFLRLTPRNSPTPMEVTVNGNAYRVSEREMLFLSKVKFMLDRRFYHNDVPFWKYNDKLAGLDDAKKHLDEPDDSDDDDSGGFSLKL